MPLLGDTVGDTWCHPLCHQECHPLCHPECHPLWHCVTQSVTHGVTQSVTHGVHTSSLLKYNLYTKYANFGGLEMYYLPLIMHE